MPELVAEIEKGTKGMTEQQRSAALSILFGAEAAYKHWAILLDTGSENSGYDEKSTELRRNRGTNV
ncbi:hypothetical protein [Paenibacillus larvae]|uniref:hypothetical protein n=1 Tax=Paenibacillus larvae TaxID=1464 RepID=UPI00288F1FC8|nr:hypothetical protein [Paenibacillus larvae]MDT2193407.1 hypothetical protein [Paenibacillus larvae]